MLGSQPHFYGADPWLVDNFAAGINPEKEKHAIFMHFEMVCNIFHFFFSFLIFLIIPNNSIISKIKKVKLMKKLFGFSHFNYSQVTGTPLSAAKRLQFNLEIVPIEDVSYTAELREMYYPLFWVEEGANLDKTFVNQIKHTVILLVLFCYSFFIR